jgi:hypothetical protein
MFDYDVLSEQEAMAERFQLLKEGEYEAVISSSEDKVSASSGNHMMDITLNVYDDNGKCHDVRDFLVFTKSMMWKVVHFADSASLLEQYEAKKLCSDLVVGKRVRVKITVETGGEIPQDKLKGKPMGSKYPDKNKVDDYIKKDSNMGADGTPPTFTDDDAPF